MLVKRFKQNPLIEPDPGVKWRSKNVLNPGVIRGRDGIFRMLIRGSWTVNIIGSDLGLALSIDGIDWNVLEKPVLKAGSNVECRLGIEDPRIVEWEGEYFIFATACSQFGGRIGIWKTKNFLTFEWVGVVSDFEDKDACIIPEVLDGKIFMLHRIPPNISISTTKNKHLSSGWSEARILSTPKEWYTIDGEKPTKIGIGGPPIRLENDWFVITHCVHKIGRVNRFYSLGYMILDGQDPTIVKYIHPEPILVPENEYEFNGSVPVVVFSNATVDVGNRIFVYWGGADTVICGGWIRKEDIKGGR